MNPTLRHAIVRSSFVFSLSVLALASAAHAQWTAPTAEELAMTSQAEVPGAPAVYLYKEEITDDKLHMWSKYVRLKVLTERGKEYANVELRQYSSSEHGGYTVNGISGRTIHPDGTIVPFTGKPFEKLIEKGQGYKEMAKVFTLPDVEVGSIIEYRYQLRYDDNRFIAPDWFVQSELYTRKAHYLWKATTEQLMEDDGKGGRLTSGIAWTPILPAGADFKQTHSPGTGSGEEGPFVVELKIHDVAPTPDEDFMPPIQSLSYRVLFYYTPYRSQEDYWKNVGNRWAKEQNKFIGPDSKVRAAVKDLVAPTDSSEQKLRKLYDAVMKLDNTSYNRDRSVAENKSQGLGEAKSTDDIWERKRGTDDQMAELFVAMARAAGMKAYLMIVTDRDRNLFLPSYFSLSQLDDDIAIVDVDGKEQFFDPGQRYCPYQQLAWKHTVVEGLRQTDSGSALDGTPDQSYKDARTDRIADLTMDEHGEAIGTVSLTFRGAPALRWRQTFLRGDDTSLRHDLQTSMEKMMPAGMDVKVNSIQKLEDYEQPLVVTFDVKGQIGSSTGKRLLVPSDIFEVNAKPTFPHEKREESIYFDYRESILDAVRVTFPASLGVESLPAAEQLPFEKTAVYSITTASTPTSVTVHRNFVLGDIIFPTAEYPALRAFYNKFESKDQEPTVLKVATTTSGGN